MTGTITELESARGCSFEFQPVGCEPTSFGLSTPSGVREVAFCVPGGFDVPPLGSEVSVALEFDRDQCFLAQLSIWDGTGGLILHAVAGTRLVASGVDVRRVPLCKTQSAEAYFVREALELTLDGEPAIVRPDQSQSVDIGSYTVRVYEAGTGASCVEFDEGCGETQDVVVIRRR